MDKKKSVGKLEQIDENLGATATQRVTIPSSVPEPEKLPSYKMSCNNFGDIDETAQKAISWIKFYNDDFRAQNAWKEFEVEMDLADEMYRAAANRVDLNSEEHQNIKATGSKIRSATYYAELKAITSGESAVMLGKESDLPVVYEPLPDSQEYTEKLGFELAKERNAVLAYTMEKSNMRDVIRKGLWSINKYGNTPLEMQWDYRIEERKIKEPVAFEALDLGDGTVIQKPVKFKRKVKKIVIADNPKLIVHDIRNVRFDAMIENMQDQSCIVLRTQKQLSELWAEQIAGKFVNMDKITKDQLYDGENEDTTLEGRQSNAGEGGDSERPNSLFDVYYGWVRLPINDETGEWNPEKELCHWYEYVLIGSLEKHPVCVKLSPLPYSCNQIPFTLAHCIEDDKGALHMGYATLIKSIIAQEMTALDQATDNVTNRNRKPWVLEKGSINVRDLTFTAGGNRVWWKKPATADPKELEIQDTTAFTLNYLNWLGEYRRKVIGTNKPMMGEALGGRTSAAESISVYEQALRPAMEDAKYKANQIFPFIAFWVSEMWKDFGDPDLVINLTGNAPVRQIKPASVYGDMRIKVTAIKQFQDNILRRKEEDAFINQILPIAIQNKVMDAEGLAMFIKQVMKNRDFDNVDGLIKTRSNFDALHVAKAENSSIVWNGVYDMPKPEEDHDVHLAEHEPFIGAVMLLPESDRPPMDNINQLKLHIQMHKQMKEQTTQAQPMQAQESAPRTAGEAFGDMAGGLENPPGTLSI